MREEIFLGIGSNLGNRVNNLRWAISELKKNKLIRVDKVSSFWTTKPLGQVTQPDFINAVVQIETDLTPSSLLFFLQFIEKKIGRRKYYKWGPRNIDIDIIFFDVLYIRKPNLIIPHPEAQKRLFVLKPILEISPEMVYPGTKVKIKDYVKKLEKENGK